MCDYSLQHITSRPAKVGDKVFTTDFSQTFTRGFAAVGEPRVAVCLLPGTEVAFEREVERELTGFQLAFFKKGKAKLGHTLARFRQINKDNPCTHHDALEFPDGQVVLLTHLRLGQHAAVLQLPADPNAVRTAAQEPAVADNAWQDEARAAIR